MPYVAQRTAPDGTVYEEEIPTPEEAAMLAASPGLGGMAVPIPPPDGGALVPAGTPPPPTQTLAYPTAGPAGNAFPGTEVGYGQHLTPDPSYAVPEPASRYAGQPLVGAPSGQGAPLVGADARSFVPATPYDFAAAEPYGVSDRAIHAGGDSTTLRSQEAYGPPPLATIPEPPASPLVRAGTPAPAAHGGSPDYSGVRPSGLRQGTILDDAGDAFGRFDRASQEFFRSPEGRVVEDAILGMAGPGGMSFGRVSPGPVGGMADDALRAASGTVDDWMRTVRSGSRPAAPAGAVPETAPPVSPPLGQPALVNAGAPGPRRPGPDEVQVWTEHGWDIRPADPELMRLRAEHARWATGEATAAPPVSPPLGAAANAQPPGPPSSAPIPDSPFPGAVWLPPGSAGGGSTGFWAKGTGSAAPESLPIPEPPLSLRTQQAFDAAQAYKPRTADEVAQALNVIRVQAGRKPPPSAEPTIRVATERVRIDPDLAARVRTGEISQQEAVHLQAARRRSTTESIPPPGSAAGHATPPLAKPATVAPANAPQQGGWGAKRALATLGLGGAAIGVAAQKAQDAADGKPILPPAESAPVPPPAQPGIFNPSTNPQSPADWQGATTRSLQLMKSYSPEDWAARTRRTPVEIGGVRQKLIESVDTPGLYVGYIDGDGAIVPVGNDVSPEQFVEMVVANAAEAPPGWGDVTTPAASADAAAGSTIYDGFDDMGGLTKIPPPVESLVWTGGQPSGDGGGGRSGGGGWIDYGDSSRSSGGRASSWDDIDDGFDAGRAFTADDFLDAAKGDRRTAERMARAANKRRKTKRGQQESASGFWPGFPFSQPPSPIRQHVLTAIAESKAAGQARKQQR